MALIGSIDEVVVKDLKRIIDDRGWLLQIITYSKK